MPITGKTLSSEESHSGIGNPSPLFRPEAVAALQQKFYGEIILVRPFSLMLLCWFALGITAAVLGFLFIGQYTESAHVPGVITVPGPAAPGAPQAKLRAEVYVPGRLLGRLHAGATLPLRCDSCSAQFAQQVGIILEVPQAPLAPAEIAQANLSMAGPVYKIAVSLPPQAAQIVQLNPSSQTGVRVEAEIPLGHQPLIKWFFERSGN
jgi:hypothetical protein